MEPIEPFVDPIQLRLRGGHHDLSVKRVEVKNHEYEDEIPHRMRNKLFPGFPSTSMFCGPPGKGKTNLLMHMLLSKHFWNQFFDIIYAWGPTLKADILYEKIELPEDQLFTESDKFEETLTEKFDEQKDSMENDRKGTPKILFIFEDMTSYKNTFQATPIFHRAYTQIRHEKGSSVALVHKYKGFDKINRDSTQHFCLFNTNLTNQQCIAEDHCPPRSEKKWFIKAFQWATKDDHSFFYINTFLPYEVRYRKGFDEVIAIEAFLPRTVKARRVKQRDLGKEIFQIKKKERRKQGRENKYKSKERKERKKERKERWWRDD